MSARSKRVLATDADGHYCSPDALALAREVEALEEDVSDAAGELLVEYVEMQKERDAALAELAKTESVCESLELSADIATDTICRALGPGHGRGGLVEHAEKVCAELARLRAAVDAAELAKPGCAAEPKPKPSRRVESDAEEQARRATREAVQSIRASYREGRRK